MSGTRSTSKLWLVDKPPQNDITGSRLPSKEQVLLFFMHQHRKLKKPIAEASIVTSEKLKEIWAKVSLPTKTEANIRLSIKKLHQEYLQLIKEKSRQTEGAVMRRTIWKDDLHDLFDISSADVLERKDVLEEDRQFLLLQREDRMSSSMGSLDKTQVATLRKKEEAARKHEERKCRHHSEMQQLMEKATIPHSSSSSASNSDDSDKDFKAPLAKRSPQPPKEKTVVRGTLDVNLTSSWDREGLSVRQASASYIATAKSLGVDASDLVISPSTVHRLRAKNRELYAKELEEEAFKDPPHLVLHWDGKLLPQAMNKWSIEDRIAVVVSGVDFEEIVGIPVASDGTGQEVANTVFKEVERLGLKDRIIGLSFDTTAANSGMLNGACIKIEALLGRSLLWLACRHHVYEIVLKHVFDQCCGRSSGPEILEFKRFQMRWEVIDRTSYRTLMDQEGPLDHFSESQRLVMVDFLRQVLWAGRHPREDYEELLQLCLIFLGGVISGQTELRFRSPGAYHQARWMAKAIYAIKIVLFENQLEVTRSMAKGLRKVAIFVSLVYVKYWHEANIPEYAPKNDMDFLKIMQTYPDKELATVVTNSFSRHLWYLSENLVSLAFFDDRVEEEEKSQMLKQLSKPGTQKELKRLERKTLLLTDMTSLSSFVTSRSKRLFQVLTDSEDFNVQNLIQDDNLKKKVKSLKVVNDSAERAIALIKKFNNSVKDESQKQFLIRVVHHQRQMMPTRTKAACSSYDVRKK